MQYFFLVKAWRQWRQIWEGMKRWNVTYSKKFKQWSDEAFNTGKEIEANEAFNASSDRFIALSLHRFCVPALLICSISYSKCSRVIYTTSLYPFWQIETKNGLLLADSRFRTFFSALVTFRRLCYLHSKWGCSCFTGIHKWNAREPYSNYISPPTTIWCKYTGADYIVFLAVCNRFWNKSKILLVLEPKTKRCNDP